jgi:hypothetical protein
MRLKSSIYVSALIRMESGLGNFATVIRKGAEESGAIFICHQKNRKQADFYGPAPQSLLHDDSGDREFERIGEDLSEAELGERIAAQVRFDPDCWVMEIEGAATPESFRIIET